MLSNASLQGLWLTTASRTFYIKLPAAICYRPVVHPGARGMGTAGRL